MAEDLFIPQNSDRATNYESILPQIKALIEPESDLVANLANISAVLKQAFGFFWVGFYLKKDTELVLGPFQGPVACTRISFDRGVCGHCYCTKKTIIVPDVELFPDHIACNSASKSEIVIPIFNSKREVMGVLDIDSDQLNDFTDLDQFWLEKIIALLEKS